MSILLIGTLDTKGIEIAFVRDQIQQAGLSVLVADAGVLGPAAFPPDLSREELYAAAGFRVEEVPANMRGRTGGAPSTRNFKLVYYYVRLLVVLLVSTTSRNQRARRTAQRDGDGDEDEA